MVITKHASKVSLGHKNWQSCTSVNLWRNTSPSLAQKIWWWPVPSSPGSRDKEQGRKAVWQRDWEEKTGTDFLPDAPQNKGNFHTFVYSCSCVLFTNSHLLKSKRGRENYWKHRKKLMNNLTGGMEVLKWTTWPILWGGLRRTYPRGAGSVAVQVPPVLALLVTDELHWQIGVTLTCSRCKWSHLNIFVLNLDVLDRKMLGFPSTFLARSAITPLLLQWQLYFCLYSHLFPAAIKKG